MYSLSDAFQIYRRDGVYEIIRRFPYWLYQQLPPNFRLQIMARLYQIQGYSNLGDPLRVYQVDPTNVEYSVSSSLFNQKLPEFGIIGGDWDQKAKKIGYGGMYFDHWENGVPWEKTDGYQRVVERLDTGDSFGHLDLPEQEQSVTEFNRYLDYLDELYNSIKTEGYKPQTNLNADNDFLNRRIHPALNEIQLFIGRDGKMCVKSGRHRLYIAQILEIEKVPVRTQVRHRKWQSIRDEIAHSSNRSTLSKIANQYFEHPDLGDLT